MSRRFIARSIIENANGKTPLMQGIKQGFRTLFLKPHRFLASRQFLYIFGVYFGTYVAANTIDTTCEYAEMDSTGPKFFGTTATNMALCILKDRAFTRMFGTVASHSFPLPSYALFAARDSLTVAASFNAPQLVSHYLQKHNISTKHTADIVAQLGCPALVQFVSTPLHLLGLDLYNRSNMKLSDRAGLIRREYLKSTLARIARIGPAFGIGGVGNTLLRSTRRRILDEPIS
ncbi:hypothetical protein BZG36_04928 [Bifiguratus adelaidae]|uniref:Uncharacterized protein n=1 Tax=Bifiguratus adelaidae TaxID=1938954 RepID=A0A261XX22_9FUNG|nr:hypothetical protein BZG36_04928 [Bifiguratus adelaidae]